MYQNEKKNIRFTLLCTLKDRQLLNSVARQLNRSQGDVLRFLIRAAARELHLMPLDENKDELYRNTI